jgi:hypothetical protein
MPVNAAINPQISKRKKILFRIGPPFVRNRMSVYSNCRTKRTQCDFAPNLTHSAGTFLLDFGPMPAQIQPFRQPIQRILKHIKRAVVD